MPVPLQAFCDALEEHTSVCITDSEGTILYANAHFCALCGYAANELIGNNHRILKSAEHSVAMFRDMWTTIAGGNTWRGEVCNLRKDGRPYWVKITIVPVPGADGRPSHYISNQTDITEHKSRLRENGALANTQTELLRLAPFGIARLSHRRFVEINEAFARILGQEPDRLLGESTRCIYQSDEQFADIGRFAYEPLTRGEIVKFETELRRGDGGTVWVIAGTCSLNIDDPMSDTLYMIQDITEHRRLEAELAAAAEKARRAERAKTLFLDTMTHELRTPINGILGTGQIIEQCLDDPELKELATLSNKSARALVRMVEMVLHYVALETSMTPKLDQVCSLSETVASIVWKGQETARRMSVTLIDELAAEGQAIEVRTHPQYLAQLLEHVVDNAIRYNRAGGSVTVAVAYPQDAISLAVIDTGVGMDSAQLAHLADPFTRFCDDGERSGFGLGMALVTRLAQLIGAELDIESEPGRGTSVRITLPR